jgi:predicted metal-dependent hydrolase
MQKRTLIQQAARSKQTKIDLAPKMEEVVPVSIFHSEVASWAKRIGVTPKEIRLRPMKRKWASCSSRGRLTFDTALLQEPAAFRREVIVHELLHLKVPNHGKVFKTLLRAHLSAK